MGPYAPDKQKPRCLTGSDVDDLIWLIATEYLAEAGDRPGADPVRGLGDVAKATGNTTTTQRLDPAEVQALEGPDVSRYTGIGAGRPAGLAPPVKVAPAGLSSGCPHRLHCPAAAATRINSLMSRSCYTLRSLPLVSGSFHATAVAMAKSTTT